MIVPIIERFMTTDRAFPTATKCCSAGT
ncbi:hypothetical protein ACF1BQ_033165 [Bradyrhizobium sp. RDT10]